MHYLRFHTTTVQYLILMLLKLKDYSAAKSDGRAGLLHLKSGSSSEKMLPLAHHVRSTRPEAYHQKTPSHHTTKSKPYSIRSSVESPRNGLVIIPRHKKTFLQLRAKIRGKSKNSLPCNLHKNYRHKKSVKRAKLASNRSLRISKPNVFESSSSMAAEKFETKKTGISAQRSISRNETLPITNEKPSEPRNFNRTRENRAQPEFTEVATKHFIIRIFARDSDNTFDSQTHKNSNISLKENVTGIQRGIYVDKPMLRNKSGLVLQEEGNFSKEVKQALKKVFMEKLLNELAQNVQKKHMDAHISYELPLPDEFVFSKVTIGNKTVKVTRNDTLHNATFPEVPVRNCTTSMARANETASATAETPSFEAAAAPGTNNGAQGGVEACSQPQNASAAQVAPDSSQSPNNNGELSLDMSNNANKNKNINITLVPSTDGKSDSYSSQTGPSNSQSNVAPDCQSSGASGSQSGGSSSSQSNCASGSQSAAGSSSGGAKSAANDDISNEIEIVNLVEVPQDESSNGGAATRPPGSKGRKIRRKKKRTRLIIKGNKKKVTALFVKFLRDVAKKLKIDVLSVAEQLVYELEAKQKKTIDKDDGKKASVKSVMASVPGSFRPIMRTLTQNIEKELDIAVQKISTSD